MTAGSRLAGNIEAIHVAAERARQLVDQILGFGRRGDNMRRRIRLDAVLDETVSLLATFLASHARLPVEQAPEPLVVQADPGQLQQILLNLCRKAAEAVDVDGTISVTMRTDAVDRPLTVGRDVLVPERYVVIAVEDDGRGMDEVTLESVFEPFFITRRQGNGLGLATALEIARAHRGTISVASRPGVGSRIEVWLPAVAADTVPAANGTERPALERGAGETVMLVERDERQRMRFEDVLAALGCEPVAFADWERAAAAAHAARGRFDGAVLFQAGGAFPVAGLPASLHEAMTRVPIALGIVEVIPYPKKSAQLADALATRLRARRDLRARLATDVA